MSSTTNVGGEDRLRNTPKNPGDIERSANTQKADLRNLHQKKKNVTVHGVKKSQARENGISKIVEILK